MAFGEAKLEAVILGLLADQGYPHTLGGLIDRAPEDVLVKSDLRDCLQSRWVNQGFRTKEYLFWWFCKPEKSKIEYSQ